MLRPCRGTRKTEAPSSPPRSWSPILPCMILDRRFVSPAVLASGGLILLSLACGKKANAPGTGSESGSTTIQSAPGDIVPESAAVSDTTPGVPAAPSAPANAPATTGKAPTASAPKAGTIIGYDSAFGPSYELDSAGRPIPLKKRKP